MPRRARIALAQPDWEGPEFLPFTFTAAAQRIVPADANRALIIITLRSVGPVVTLLSPNQAPLQLASPVGAFVGAAGAGVIAFNTLSQSYQVNGALVTGEFWGIITGVGSAMAGVWTWRYTG
jgi:hypothetical protein